jgi:hypothetical protein
MLTVATTVGTMKYLPWTLIVAILIALLTIYILFDPAVSLNDFH